MQYKVEEINNNIAKIVYSDDTWAFIELNADMTESDLDELVYMIAPAQLKTGAGKPSFIKAGQTRTAAKPAEEASE